MPIRMIPADIKRKREYVCEDRKRNKEATVDRQAWARGKGSHEDEGGAFGI